jgi:membrane protease YdiL (CAAX protease family)
MSTQEITSEKNQYTLSQILGIWLVGGAPIWLLGWVAYPAMSAGLPPMDAGLLRLKLLTVGLIWEFVLAMIILYREEGNIRLGTISRRFRLNHPVSARTGETKKALWWWIVPLSLLVAFIGMAVRPMIVNFIGTAFPSLTGVINAFESKSMYDPALFQQWVGAWGWLGLIFVQSLFNAALGEEFLFRGVLLPKMEGVFGKWDWVANGVIFGLYHIHQPWGIPSSILTGLIYAFSAKRFRTTWFSIILHSGQSVFMLFLVLGLVLGLA